MPSPRSAHLTQNERPPSATGESATNSTEHSDDSLVVRRCRKSSAVGHMYVLTFGSTALVAWYTLSTFELLVGLHASEPVGHLELVFDQAAASGSVVGALLMLVAAVCVAVSAFSTHWFAQRDPDALRTESRLVVELGIGRQPRGAGPGVGGSNDQA